jgi:hypothetical protein
MNPNQFIVLVLMAHLSVVQFVSISGLERRLRFAQELLEDGLI